MSEEADNVIQFPESHTSKGRMDRLNNDLPTLT